MKIQVFTRSQDTTLYDMMKEFIPEEIECVRCTGFDKWWEATDFIYHVIEKSEKWAVILDEDAFVTRWQSIDELVTYMDVMGYDIAGHPDGGLIPHRCHSFLTINPYFNIINAEEFRDEMKRQRVSASQINQCGYQTTMEDLKPEWLHGVYNHTSTEPFAGFYYWTAAFTKPLFLKANTHYDSLSTISLDLDGNEFIYHSWMSRQFNSVPSQRERILNLYNEAKSKKV